MGSLKCPPALLPPWCLGHLRLPARLLTTHHLRRPPCPQRRTRRTETVPSPTATSTACGGVSLAVSLKKKRCQKKMRSLKLRSNLALGLRRSCCGTGAQIHQPVQPAQPSGYVELFASSVYYKSEDTSEGKADADPLRVAVCTRLRETGFMDPSDPKFMFGRGYTGPLTPPKVIWKSNQPPRKDHSCPKWLTATEFEDHPEALSCRFLRDAWCQSCTTCWLKLRA